MIDELSPFQQVAAARALHCWTVLIASELRLLREGVAERIDATSGLLVAGLCEKLAHILAALPEHPGAIVLMDAAFPDGLDALRTIRLADPSARVVVFAVYETEDNIVAWAKAGAAGYIPHTAALRDFVTFIEGINRGEQICSAAVASRLVRRIGSLTSVDGDAGAAHPADSLTSRESEIIRLLGEGLSNKDIARRLKIELSTTKSHVHNLMRKLGLARRAQVAHWLHKHADTPRERVGRAIS